MPGGQQPVGTLRWVRKDWVWSLVIGFESQSHLHDLWRWATTTCAESCMRYHAQTSQIMLKLQQFSRPKLPEGDRFWRVQGPPRRYLKTCKTGKTCKSKGWGGWKESWHTCNATAFVGNCEGSVFLLKSASRPRFRVVFFWNVSFLAERKIQWVQHLPRLVISRVTTPFVGYDPIYPLIRPIFYVCFKLFFSMTKMQISRSLFARCVVVFWSKFTYRNHPDQKMLKGPLPWAF